MSSLLLALAARLPSIVPTRQGVHSQRTCNAQVSLCSICYLSRRSDTVQASDAVRTGRVSTMTFMRALLSAFALLSRVALAAPAAPQWRFDLKNQTTGIVALEAIVVSPTLVVMFDRVSNDPLQINGHSAWGALWDLETSSVRALNVITNSFCASGALLSNGSMVSGSHACQELCTHRTCRLALGVIPPTFRPIRYQIPVTSVFAFSSHVPRPPVKVAPCSRTRRHCIWLHADGIRRRPVFSTVVS